MGVPAPGHGYRPVDGDSFACHNGSQAYNYIITSGAWWLQAGELPRLLMTLRTPSGAYAQPALLPDLAVSGRLRVFVRTGTGAKWLDKFESIDAVLAPGAASWVCSDQDVGVTIRLEANPLIDRFGFIATALVQASVSQEVTLTWAFGRVAGDDDTVTVAGDYVRITNPRLKYTEAYVACERAGAIAGKGEQAILHQTNAPPALVEHAGTNCALLIEKVMVQAGTPTRARFLCLSGYRGYNGEGVAAAYHRLEFRPFADPRWVEQMKPKWFDHWIGQGLEPEKKFLHLREHVNEVVAQSVEFWAKQKQRLRIKTPDERFDTVVNSHSAMAREIFEYPAFMHGLTYAKYGKINHGYYGFETAGMHDEVADSLKFVSGTQDVKGRQRYFMTTFAISDWHEDMDFYFTEQVWWHWRWTGDRQFLHAMWPSVQRALEHGLACADPDGDGIMTGYYEMWDADQNNPGGYSALETAMGWAALRAAAQMAGTLNPYEATHAVLGQMDRASYAQRYQTLADLVERQYGAHLWNPEVGAWAAAEFNGVNRPRPHTCEQNYAIWRGLGDPLRNYMAMRFIRENYHRSDLLPGSTIEFINDWWPIIWSHQYPASGDTCASFHSACVTGQADEFWPAFKTVYETAFINNGAMWHSTGSRSMEMEPLFLAAVVDGLFGVQPWFGDNRLVLRPSLPWAWNDAEFNHADVTYRLHRSATTVSLHVTTPVARILRVELPVRQSVKSASLNGQPVPFKLEPAVNGCRVVMESPAAQEWQFDLKLANPEPSVAGTVHLIAGQKAGFRVQNAVVAKVHDPQEKMSEVNIASADKEAGATEVSFVAKQTGKFTVFLELRAGEVSWYKPLDLEVRQPWTIVQRYIPPATKGGPLLTSPAVDTEQKTLKLEMQNNGAAQLNGPCRVSVAGHTFEQPLTISTGSTGAVAVSLAPVWDRLSPGALPFTVEFCGGSRSSAACDWALGKEPGDLASRQLRLDLAPHCNADMTKLFGPQTQWRTDYAGAQHGVDWRIPPPLRDQHGYVLLNNVMSLYDYGILPEQISSLTQWKLPEMKADFNTTPGIRFRTTPGRILAVCCTEPYPQFPSTVTLKLDQPRRLEKLYLLTANLTKTLKCYYPGAEVAVRYADGTTSISQMIPPYTMPSAVNHICPIAHAIRFGEITYAHPTPDKSCFLSVIDLPLDPTKPIESFEFRCVATETLLGIVGATGLQAK